MSSKSRRTHSSPVVGPPIAEGEHPPEGTGHRQARLEHILIQELQSLISDEAIDPSLDGIKVLAVHLAPDGGHARVAYAVTAALDREQELASLTRGGLQRATPFLRAKLAEHLQLKKLPKLSFTFVGLTEAGSP